MALSDYLRNLQTKIGHDMIMMPGVVGIVINAQGELLVQRSVDNGQWYLPGGGIDPGEEPADAVVREVWEETGIRVIPKHLSGVYTDPMVTYPNGDQVIYICLTFVCEPIGGDLSPHDDESLEVGYYPIDHLPDLSPNDRLRLQHAQSNAIKTYFRVNQGD